MKNRMSAAAKNFAAELRKTFRSFRNRNFKIYSLGQLLSLSGNWMQDIALSWMVFELTGSATALGMVALARGIPMLLLTYVGGMLADRFDRKKLLYVAVTLQATQALLLAYLTYTGLLNVYWIVGLSLAGGCFGAIEMPTRQSFVPDLVPKKELANVVGINSSIRNMTRIVGPAVAGVLLGLFGGAICFLVNAISYIAALASLFLIRLPAKHQTEDGAGGTGNSGNEVEKTGIWATLRSPAILYVLLFVAATSMFGFQFMVLLPVVASRVLGGGAEVLGFLSATAGVGALIGSLFLASRGNPEVLRRGIGLAAMVLSVAVVTLGWSTWLPLSLIAVAFASASVSLQIGGSITLIQTAVNSSTRGRVMAIFSTLMAGFSPFAALMAGWLTETVGIGLTLSISAVAVFLAASTYLILAKKTMSKKNQD